MINIDMQRLRDALPKHAVIILRKTVIDSKTTVWLDCYVRFPSLSEADFEMCKDWQRDIIGAEAISEFYTEEMGNHWIVYLKRLPIEFVNLTEFDIESFSGLSIDKIKELIQSTGQ